MSSFKGVYKLEQPNAITSIMDEKRRFPPSKTFSKKAHIQSIEQYERIYRESVESPPRFWAKKAEELIDWYEKWDENAIFSWDKSEARHTWFKGAKLNVTYICLDRHLEPGMPCFATSSSIQRYANSPMCLRRKGLKKGTGLLFICQ